MNRRTATAPPRRAPKQRPPRRGSKRAVLECEARWAGGDAELDRLTAEVQRLRDEELENRTALSE